MGLPAKIKKTVSFRVTPPGSADQVVGTVKTLDHGVKVHDTVWMRDKTHVFVKGVVVSGVDDSGTLGIELQGGSALVRQRPDEVYPANQPNDSPDDTTALIHLNEPCVLDAIKVRYERNDIYAYTGSILVALNPFKPLDIYDEAAMAHFTKATSATPPSPHVYSVAEKAYTHMRRTGLNQAIIMSGESGAGKTETTKHVMKYLARRAAKTANLETLSQAIIESNTITEAFGNAKTARNANSSRFGKYLQVFFSTSGAVAAGGLQTYLLERPRVSQIAKDERSYHVFYELLAGASDTKRRILHLDKAVANDFRVLKSSGCLSIDGVSDAAKFSDLHAGLQKVGLSPTTCDQIYAVVAGVMVSIPDAGVEGEPPGLPSLLLASALLLKF